MAGVGQGGSRKGVSGNMHGEVEQDWGGGVTREQVEHGGKVCVALREGHFILKCYTILCISAFSYQHLTF